MFLFPAARIGDEVTHDTVTPSGTIAPPPTPPVAGQVTIEGMPAAYVGCLVVCSGATSAGMAHPPPGAGAPPVPIVLGSPTVLIHGRPAARWATSGDFAGCSAQFGNLPLASLRTVRIGGPTASADFPFSFDAKGNLWFGKAIGIAGDDLFKAKVANRLIRIASLPVGKKLIRSLEDSGKHVGVYTTSDNNSYCSAVKATDATLQGRVLYGDNRSPLLDAEGTPVLGTGKGSDSVVQLNPEFRLHNDADPNSEEPNDAVLFHELQHANHNAHGASDPTPDEQYDNNEEKNTIANGETTENRYLLERGYPWQRTDHDQGFKPAYE